MNIKLGSLLRPGLFFFAISAVITTIFGMVIEARAQVDPNIQSRLNAITARLDLSQISSPSDFATVPAYWRGFLEEEQGIDQSNGCTPDHKLYNHLIHLYKNELHKYVPKLELAELKPNPEELKDHNYKKEVAVKLREILEALKYLRDNGILKPEEIKPFPKELEARSKLELEARSKLLALYLQKFDGKIDLCINPQPTTFKVIGPFNPDYETNVLKSNQNIYPDTSLGFGGALQVITGGVGPYDLVGASIQSASVRYNKFYATSLDAIITQGVYQHFIGAYSYLQDGSTFEITPPSPDDKCPNKCPNKPAQGLVTVDTIAFGFQNQTAYTPTFHLETVDLFTPQVTLSRQNISFTGADPNYVCGAALSDDFRKSGFCYYADLSLTVGQTFSDVLTQQNANVAVSVSLGKRFDQSDWKATLQTIVTERSYEDVVGGRNDVQLQIGPSLTYSPQPFVGSLDGVSMLSLYR